MRAPRPREHEDKRVHGHIVLGAILHEHCTKVSEHQHHSVGVYIYTEIAGDQISRLVQGFNHEMVLHISTSPYILYACLKSGIGSTSGTVYKLGSASSLIISISILRVC